VTAPAGLEAEVGLTLGRLGLHVSLSVGPGEVVALLGPNGAGKTTLLRALAGLVPLGQGSVVLGGEVLEDVAAGVRLAPEQRRVGVVFQDRLLFPHLSVLDNVGFGLRCAGASRPGARREAQEWLERLGLGDRGASHPATLSGGEAQRVALARALAGRPRLLLLDEPLSALDASARVEVRRHLRHHLASFEGVRLLVTHDPLEAAALGHRVVVLEEGRVVQSGSLAQLSARPRSQYVADLVGVNLFEGQADGDRVALRGGGDLVAVGGPRSGPVLAVVHPRAVALHRRRPEGTPRNVWAGTVEAVDLEGERARVQVAGPPTVVAEVTPAAVADLALAPGQEVWASVKAAEVSVYPA
jgi:molybdate transport system ATP-binding protein